MHSAVCMCTLGRMVLNKHNITQQVLLGLLNVILVRETHVCCGVIPWNCRNIRQYLEYLEAVVFVDCVDDVKMKAKLRDSSSQNQILVSTNNILSII